MVWDWWAALTSLEEGIPAPLLSTHKYSRLPRSLLLLLPHKRSELWRTPIKGGDEGERIKRLTTCSGRSLGSRCSAVACGRRLEGRQQLVDKLYVKTAPLCMHAGERMHKHVSDVSSRAFQQVQRGWAQECIGLPFVLFLDGFQISEPCSAPSH